MFGLSKEGCTLRLLPIGSIKLGRGVRMRSSIRHKIAHIFLRTARNIYACNFWIFQRGLCFEASIYQLNKIGVRGAYTQNFLAQYSQFPHEHFLINGLALIQQRKAINDQFFGKIFMHRISLKIGTGILARMLNRMKIKFCQYFIRISGNSDPNFSLNSYRNLGRNFDQNSFLFLASIRREVQPIRMKSWSEWKT